MGGGLGELGQQRLEDDSAGELVAALEEADEGQEELVGLLVAGRVDRVDDVPGHCETCQGLLAAAPAAHRGWGAGGGVQFGPLLGQLAVQR
jgi:hypothetical protein